MKRYVLILFLLLAALAASAEDTRKVSGAPSFAAAVNAVNASGAGSYTIVLTASFTAAPVKLTGGTGGGAAKTVTLRGDGGVRTISNGGGDPLFTVLSDVTLILEDNVTLDGNNKEQRIVWVEGALVMRGGSTLSNGANHGVLVLGGGVFTMEGGTISGNKGAYGGGVYIGSEGNFTMKGGTISGNTAVYDGGGVWVHSGSVFTMTGGTIGENTAHYGGGVFVDYGVFTMTGGTVSGNTAAARKHYGYDVTGGMGGGVWVGEDSVFTMAGGTISGNAAGINGGGVCVQEYGVFVKSGGTIDASNKAPYGRAVYAQDGRDHYRVRDSAAGPEVNMDSRDPGGDWERGE